MLILIGIPFSFHVKYIATLCTCMHLVVLQCPALAQQYYNVPVDGMVLLASA